jgi:hypothetical protein
VSGGKAMGIYICSAEIAALLAGCDKAVCFFLWEPTLWICEMDLLNKLRLGTQI